MFDEDFELPKLKSETPSTLPTDDTIINVTPEITKPFKEDEIENIVLPESNNSELVNDSNIDEPTVEIPVLNNTINENINNSSIFDVGEISENKIIEPVIEDLNNSAVLTETAFGDAIAPNDNNIENFSNIEPIIPETIPSWDNPSIDNEIKIELEEIQPVNNEIKIELEEIQPVDNEIKIELEEIQPINQQTQEANTDTIVIPPISNEQFITETTINNKEVINEPILNEPTLEFNNITPEPINLETTSETILQNNNLTSEGIETLDISPEPMPTWEAPVTTIPVVSETVVYDTPDTSIAFQVDGSITPPPTPEENFSNIQEFSEYIEPNKEKKDPIIILSTLLIIASLIMAAVYFFMTQTVDLPFSKTTTTTTTTTTATTEEPKTWPVEGRYMESESKICPNKPIELTLNADNSFTFNDLTYDSIENKCTDIEIKGTYQLVDGNLTLTTTDNKTINAQRKDLASHAEIIITGTGGIEITLYRTVHNAS